MTHLEKKQPHKEKPLILYAPLDWGLGHTTRSIPLIRAFLEGGCRVLVACNSTQKEILAQEFPELEFKHLKGFGLKYGQNRTTTLIRLLLQVPKILIRIKNEIRVVKSIATKEGISAVVSDNRYGAYSPGLPSVFITHQLWPATGLGKLADRLCRITVKKYITRFDECWIPDLHDEGNLAGALSHPSYPFFRGTDIRYIGPYSRFEPCSPIADLSGRGDELRLLILLSGPEPQRSILEEKLLQQVAQLAAQVVLVRGRPSKHVSGQNISSLRVINYAGTAELNKLVCESDFVICRPGYSTIMDMLKLKKKLIVIPTPGQAEQEYLGNYLHQKKMVISSQQNDVDLPVLLNAAKTFAYQEFGGNFQGYQKAVSLFVGRLK